MDTKFDPSTGRTNYEAISGYATGVVDLLASCVAEPEAKDEVTNKILEGVCAQARANTQGEKQEKKLFGKLHHIFTDMTQYLWRKKKC